MGKVNVKNSSGFTIVELLVVIVIIGILAAITIISYTGISQKATVASLQSDLINAANQLKLDQVSNASYPATLAAANGGKGIAASAGTSYVYTVGNTTSPKTFCITATKNGQKYYINQEGTSFSGSCPVLNLDVSDSSSYIGSGTAWTDLSGNGSNGILSNVGYSSLYNGYLTFNGSTSYASISAAPNITTAGSISVWINVNAWGSQFDSIVFKGPGTSYPSIDYGLFRAGANNAFLGTINDGTNSLSGSGPVSSTIITGQWYNLVFTWDSTITRFYTNNVLTSSVAYSHGAGSRSSNMKIGADVSGTTYFFNGSIANVRIYDHAMSNVEIDQNFNLLKGHYGL